MARAVVSRWALAVLLSASLAAGLSVERLAWGQTGASGDVGSSKSQPLRTWGGVAGTREVGLPAPPSAPPATPPPPPPATLGVPLGASEVTPSNTSTPPTEAPRAPEPSPASDAREPIVRTPGRIGLRYLLEGIEVRGNTTTLARVVLRYIPFRVGDPLDVDDPELVLTRFRLLGTGFFRDAQLTLRRGSQRGNAILVVTVRERNTVVVNDLWLGLSTDANANGATRPLTAYGGVDVSETNLAGTGVTLGGAVAVAEDQLALRTRFADPQFLKTEWTVQAELLFNSAKDFFGNGSVLVYDNPTGALSQSYAVASYQRLGGSLGAGHDLGISTRLYLDYRLEHIDATLPLAASDHSGNDVVPIDFGLIRGDSVLSTLRASLVYDTRDEPFLPTRGNRLSLLGELSLSPLGSDYPYAKFQAHASHWLPLPWGGHVLELDAFAGAIFGSAPSFEQYYVGDFSDLLPDRVLGLNFDRRGAPNFLSTDIGEVRYGQYAAELDAQYRVPLYRGHRSVYEIDLFGSAGVYSVATQQDLTLPPTGYTGFARVPIDLTFNLGLQIETSAGGFTFGLSNFLGFIPNYGGGR